MLTRFNQTIHRQSSTIARFFSGHDVTVIGGGPAGTIVNSNLDLTKYCY